MLVRSMRKGALTLCQLVLLAILLMLIDIDVLPVYAVNHSPSLVERFQDLVPANKQQIASETLNIPGLRERENFQ